MAQREALEVIRHRNDFYRDGYRKCITMVLILLIVNIFLGVTLWYQIQHRTIVRYFATDLQGRVYPMHPLNQPLLSKTALSNWVNEATVAAYTYNFVSYRKDLEHAGQYFSPGGWKRFESALVSSNNLKRVIAQKLVVSATPVDVPKILDERIIQGRYTWKVSVPILVKYQSASRSYTQSLDILVVIQRVAAVDSMKNGVAIVNFVAKQRSARK